MKNLQIMGLLITSRNMAIFLISSMILGLLAQLQNLLTVASGKIARTSKMYRNTPDAALDISKAFYRTWHADLPKLKSYGISGLVFAFISSFVISSLFVSLLWIGCKPDNFESHNSLKLSFTKIRCRRSDCVQCE